MFSCADKGVLQEFHGTNSKLICKEALCKIISWHFPKMLNYYLKFAAAYNGIWWQLWNFQKGLEGAEDGKRARTGIHKNAQSIPLINSYFTNLFGYNSLIFKKYLRDLSHLL